MPKKDEAHVAGHFGEGQRRGLDDGVKHSHEDDVLVHRTTRREAQLEKARRLAADGERWRREEIGADQFITDYALSRAAEGKRFSGQELAELVRSHEFVNHRTGEPTSINNSLVAWLVRELVKRYPHLGPFVEMRRSIFDLLKDGGEVQDDDQETDPCDVLDDLVALMGKYPYATAADVLDYAQGVWGL